MSLIYIAEDDENISEIESYALSNAGFEVESFPAVEQLLKRMQERMPNLLLLDVMLPDGDGLDVIRMLRQDNTYKKLPIILVTAKDKVMDVVKGLENGADDYVTKPFSVLELTSRIKSLLRRVEPVSDVLEMDGLILNDQERMVLVNQEEAVLAKKEYELLKLLLENRNRVLSRQQILEKVWGYDFEGVSRTLDMHVKTLRKKLGEWGNHIVTVRGVGYVVKTS